MDPKELKSESLKNLSNEKVNESKNARRQFLLTLPVEKPVHTLTEARDPKLIEWATIKLVGGMDLDELRARMGLIPGDPRWTEVRRQLIHNQLPDSHENALIDQYTKHQDFLEQLQGFLKEVDAKIDSPGSTEEDRKNEPAYYKLKLETIKSLIETHSDKFHQYMEVQRLKAQHRGHGKLGVQIIIQNKIPRPIKALASGEVEPIDE